MLSGRLGLEKARIPHADRQGLVWLDRGRLEVEDGCLRFVTAGGGALAAGDYQIPYHAISIVLLGPGSSVTHDALRLLARDLARSGGGTCRPPRSGWATVQCPRHGPPAAGRRIGPQVG